MWRPSFYVRVQRSSNSSPRFTTSPSTYSSFLALLCYCCCCFFFWPEMFPARGFLNRILVFFFCYLFFSGWRGMGGRAGLDLRWFFPPWGSEKHARAAYIQAKYITAFPSPPSILHLQSEVGEQRGREEKDMDIERERERKKNPCSEFSLSRISLAPPSPSPSPQPNHNSKKKKEGHHNRQLANKWQY